MSLGHNILILRKKKNLTQEDLATLVGVKKQQISQYENEVNTPSKEMLYQLAKILNVSVSDLYEEASERKEPEDRTLVDKLYKLIDVYEKTIDGLSDREKALIEREKLLLSRIEALEQQLNAPSAARR